MMSTSGGQMKRRRTEPEQLEAMDMGPAAGGAVGDVMKRRTKRTRQLLLARKDDPFAFERTGHQEEEEKEGVIRPLGFEGSQLSTVVRVPPPQKSRPNRRFFLYMSIKGSLTYVDDAYLTPKQKEMMANPTTNEQQIGIQRSVDRKKKREISWYEKHQSMQQKGGRRRMEKRFTPRHERMMYEDVYKKILRKSQALKKEFNSNRELGAVPLPPIFHYNDDRTISHIKDLDDPTKPKPMIEFDVLEDFGKPPPPTNRKVSVFIPWEQLELLELYVDRVYLTKEQSDKLRALDFTADQLREWKDEVSHKKRALRVNTNLDRGRSIHEGGVAFYLKQYKEMQEFFGADRLDFHLQCRGFSVPPIYLFNWGYPRHIKKNTPFEIFVDERHARIQETRKAFSEESDCMATFTSPYSFIFSSPVEPMKAHYLYLKNSQLALYLVLVKEIDRLEQNPLQQGDLAARDLMLEKFCRQIDPHPDAFEEEQAARLSVHLNMSPSDVLAKVRLLCSWAAIDLGQKAINKFIDVLKRNPLTNDGEKLKCLKKIFREASECNGTINQQQMDQLVPHIGLSYMRIWKAYDDFKTERNRKPWMENLSDDDEDVEDSDASEEPSEDDSEDLQCRNAYKPNQAVIERRTKIYVDEVIETRIEKLKKFPFNENVSPQTRLNSLDFPFKAIIKQKGYITLEHSEKLAPLLNVSSEKIRKKFQELVQEDARGGVNTVNTVINGLPILRMKRHSPDCPAVKQIPRQCTCPEE